MNWTTLFKKFTNWKYIVWLLTIAFLSIGSFTSATEITFNWNGSEYDPDSFTAVNEFNLENSVTSYQCNSTICSFKIINWNWDDAVITFRDNTFYCVDYALNCNSIPADNYTITDYWDWTFEYITINIPDWNENSLWNIIEWWTSNFTPIITKLSNIAGEFIPYMIYIAISCLGVTIVFKALRYILWYLQSKSKWAVRWK